MAKVSSNKVLYQFPAKIRVLAVDNDPTALEFIKNTCNQCKYEVSICTESSLALNLVRERKDCIDVILIEFHMPTMNGYEFLQHVSKEIDVPVIVMSLDHSKNTVMKAVQLGACDFWIKPLHDHQFKNMWTHVVRKCLKENKIQKDFVGELEDDERSRKWGNDNFEFGSSSVVRDQSNNSSREAGDHVGESKHFCSSNKKPRVIWLPELHRKFVMAVKNLGLNQAVPKRILEEMNVPGLTRENVASHLQKYRDYLKRNSGVAKTHTQEHNVMQMPNMVPMTTESGVGASYGRHYQTQSVPHPCHFQAEQALAKCLSNIANNFPQSTRTIADPSGARPPSNAVAAIQRNNVLVGAVQQSLIHQQMIISGNPSSSISRNIDYLLLSPQSRNPNPLRFVTASIPQQLQNSSLTSVASFPASSMSPYGSRPCLSLNQEPPNMSASGLSNQNSSTYTVDNTTKDGSLN